MRIFYNPLPACLGLMTAGMVLSQYTLDYDQVRHRPVQSSLLPPHLPLSVPRAGPPVQHSVRGQEAGRHPGPVRGRDAGAAGAGGRAGGRSRPCRHQR